MAKPPPLWQMPRQIRVSGKLPYFLHGAGKGQRSAGKYTDESQMRSTSERMWVEKMTVVVSRTFCRISRISTLPAGSRRRLVRHRSEAADFPTMPGRFPDVVSIPREKPRIFRSGASPTSSRQPGNLFPSFAPADACNGTGQIQIFCRRHIAVEFRHIRQISHQPPRRESARTNFLSTDSDLSGVRRAKSQGQPHGGGFSGAVRADKA